MFKVMAVILLLQSAKCEVGCKAEGYDTGTFYKKKCLCIDSYEFEDVTSKRYYSAGKARNTDDLYSFE